MIRFPGFDAQITPLPSPDVVISLGGRAPDPAWFAAVTYSLREMSRVRPSGCPFEVWAVDSGYGACRVADIVPDRVIGDFDSIGPRDREHAEIGGLLMESYPVDKDMTDYQLALKRVGERHEGNVKRYCFVTGCWGGRFDHTFSNVYSALWAREWGTRVMCMADERESFFFLEGGEELELSFMSPRTLSLLALTPCVGVNLNGTHWELNSVKLTPRMPFAISNRIMDNRSETWGRAKISVSLSSGTLGVYVLNDSLPKRGL